MPQIFKSLQSAWQTARANVTNQIPVRDCQTQTFSQAELELALKQAAENAANHKRDPETSLSRKEIAREGDAPKEDEASLKDSSSTPSLGGQSGKGPKGEPRGDLHGGDPNAPNDKNAKIKKVAKYAGIFTAVAVSVGGGVFIAAPAALTALGFTAGGIASGSVGAWMMSVSAVMSGGGVPAGGAVAILQSAGATGGFAASTCAALGLGSAAVGTGLIAVGEVTASAVRYIKRPQTRNPTKNAETQTDDDDDDDLAADAPMMVIEPLMGTVTSQDGHEAEATE